MKVTIQNIGATPDWASKRGTVVEFTMDFCAKGSLFRKGRTLAKQGDRAYILSNYVNEQGQVTVQPMLRYYCIHGVPIEILQFVKNHVTEL